MHEIPPIVHQFSFALFRQQGRRPQSGQVYEDVAAELTAQTVAAAAEAPACAAAPSIAASGSSQPPAAALSSRPKRPRRQTNFFDNSYAAKSDTESSDSSNDSNYSATHGRCKQQRTSRQTRGSCKRGQWTIQELWPSCKNECTDSTSKCGVRTGDSQGASASGHPTPATQQVAGGQAVQDWPDDASSDGERKQTVHNSSLGRQVTTVQKPCAVTGQNKAEQAQTVISDSDEEEEAPAPGGSLSTAYDTDGDFVEDDAPVSVAPLPLLSGPTLTARDQHHPVTMQGISPMRLCQALVERAEPTALLLPVEAAAAVLTPVPPVKVPLASATPRSAEPSSLGATPGQPHTSAVWSQAGAAQTPCPVSSPFQETPSASAPQPTTVAELVAAVNAEILDSEDAIQDVQMKVFSRLEHLLELEDDEKHDPLDELRDLAELTPYQAKKIRKHYLKLKLSPK